MTEHFDSDMASARTAASEANWPAVPGYEIIEELGRGGMGVVYKARAAGSDRLVALKMIREGALAGELECGRFHIECEAAARMQHPNIVQIHEVGEHAGHPFFAMQFVNGGSLADWIADAWKQSIDWSFPAARLLAQVARAVHHAHERGVVHRDLKPANVLLETAAETDPSVPVDLNSADPILADFGLAKRLDSESTAWTQEGAVVGTASYMAPEQAEGRVGQLGPAVDVYALGAILYELLTGRPPFRAESWSQLIQKVLNDEPFPPRKLCPHIPCDLETICLKCLEKDPARRYSSAAELADDLYRFLETLPIIAVRPGRRERLARQAARDGYEIIDEIGSGPRSTVYRALNQPLKRFVALKVFDGGLCTREEWEARVRDSAVLWAALTHPQIVPFGRTGWWDDSPWVEMEFVPHGNLASKLSGLPGPPLPAVRLVAQLAEIVCYMHRQGVVHGNLKSTNILLAADGIPRLADCRLTGGLFLSPFSVADQQPAHLASLAPELVRAPRMELRPSMDIYSLGAILYELLTGRPPHVAETAQASSEQSGSQDWVCPSHYNPKVTPRLETICLRCLRLNPWQRYARSYNLLLSLRGLLDEPMREGPPARRRFQ